MQNSLTINSTGTSTKWKYWRSMLTFTTCKPCENNHGKIFPIQADVKGQIPAHIFCKCRMEPVRTVKAGKATYSGIFGADVFLSLFGRLPDNYINKK